MPVKASCRYRITPLSHELREPYHYRSHHMDAPAPCVRPTTDGLGAALERQRELSERLRANNPSRLSRLGRALVRGLEALGRANYASPFFPSEAPPAYRVREDAVDPELGDHLSRLMF